METAGNIIIIVSLVFMFFGVVALFKFETFYLRILITSKIDTVGMITLIIGFALKHGLSFFTGKLLLLAAIILVLNPLVAHIIARCAYLSNQENG